MKSIFPTLLTAACAVSHVSAQSTIETAETELGMIKTLTDNLTTTIASWTGEPADVNVALEINTLSMNLVTYINNATTQLKSMPTVFDTTESFEIGGPTQQLAYSVNASIAALIKQKPNFVKNMFTGLVNTSLHSQLEASASFSGVLLSYVPSDVLPVAQALNNQITASLNQGLDCFNNNVSCITATKDPTRTLDAALDSGAIKATSAAPRTVNFAGAVAIAIAAGAAVFVL